MWKILRSRDRFIKPSRDYKKVEVKITIVGFKRVNVRDTYSNDVQWDIKFRVDDHPKVYRTKTGIDSYTANYVLDSPLLRYLEKLDIDTAIRRYIVNNLLTAGMTADDIEIVYVD